MIQSHQNVTKKVHCIDQGNHLLHVQDHPLITEEVGHQQELMMKTNQSTENGLDRNLLKVSISLLTKQMSLEMKNQSIVTEGGRGRYLQKVSIIEAPGHPQEVWKKINISTEGGPGLSL
jgi:hypothetical protein